MHRVAPIVVVILLLITGICQAQSLADAARENRKQKAKDGSAATKVITSDDFSAPPNVTIHLVPGTTSTGQGTLVAPGRGKHSYLVTNLDATRCLNGGILHIVITMGTGASEASFDLYSQDVPLPSEGLPHSLASAHNVPSGGSAKIDYRFDRGGVFQFAAEGSWNAKAGETNTYSLVAEVGNR